MLQALEYYRMLHTECGIPIRFQHTTSPIFISEKISKQSCNIKKILHYERFVNDLFKPVPLKKWLYHLAVGRFEIAVKMSCLKHLCFED